MKQQRLHKPLTKFSTDVVAVGDRVDYWQDLYVACDSTPAILYRNNHNGTFKDTAADVGVAFNEDGREQAGMGVAALALLTVSVHAIKAALANPVRSLRSE